MDTAREDQDIFTLVRELEQSGGAGGNLNQVVRLGLKFLDRLADKVSDEIFSTLARVALNVAYNSDIGSVGKQGLPEDIREDAILMVAEQMIVTNRVTEAGDLLLVHAAREIEKPGVLL